MRRSTALTIAVAAVLAAIVPAAGEEGRIPIFEPVVLNGGSGNINGQYVLTRDIAAPAVGGTLAIEIIGTGSEQIEIDLNGFEVTGNTLGDTAIRVTNVRGLELRNGTVTSPAVTNAVIEVGTASAAGKAIVEDLRVSGGDRGIFLNGVPNFFVRRNLISDFASVSSEGISISAGGFPGTTPFQGIIESNVLRDDGAGGGGSFGISVFHPTEGVIIRSNTVQAGFTGVQLSSATGALVEDNYVTDNASIGYNIANGGSLRIINNRVEGASQHGFQLFNVQNSLITDNIATDCSLHGFYVTFNSGGNLFERNVANLNGKGFQFDSGSDNNRYGRNSAFGNTGGCGVGIATCGQANFCDQGANNLSFGDNLIPGPPPC